MGDNDNKNYGLTGLLATVRSLKTAFSYKKNLDDQISHFSNEFQDQKKSVSNYSAVYPSQESTKSLRYMS